MSGNTRWVWAAEGGHVYPIWMVLTIPSRSARSCAEMSAVYPARITSRVPSTSRIHSLFCSLGACDQRFGATYRHYWHPEIFQTCPLGIRSRCSRESSSGLLPSEPVDGDIARGVAASSGKFAYTEARSSTVGPGGGSTSPHWQPSAYRLLTFMNTNPKTGSASDLETNMAVRFPAGRHGECDGHLRG